MTRFARARGSKASNVRVPEEATSWSVMKQQIKKIEFKDEDAGDNSELCSTNVSSVNLSFGKTNTLNCNNNVWEDFGNKIVHSNLSKSVCKPYKELQKTKNTNKELKNKLISNGNPISSVNSEVAKYVKTCVGTFVVDSKETLKGKISKGDVSNKIHIKKKGKEDETVNNLHVTTHSTHIQNMAENLDKNKFDRKKKQHGKKFIAQNDIEKELAPIVDGGDSEIGFRSFNNEHIDNKTKISNQFCTAQPSKGNYFVKEKPFAEDDIYRMATQPSKPNYFVKEKPFAEDDEYGMATQPSKPNYFVKEKSFAEDDKYGMATQPSKRNYFVKEKSFGENTKYRMADQSSFQGFPVKKEDADRLYKLRKDLRAKGVPRKTVLATLHAERRKAEKALARERNVICYKCRNFGHSMSDCPELDDQSGICFKCGSTEHSAKQCRVVQGDLFKFTHCFICQEQGHISRQCPDNPRGLYPKGGACKICGDVTHLRSDCPTLVNEKEKSKITVGTFNDKFIEALDEEFVELKKDNYVKKNVVKF